jgi:hypothetical protein
MFLKGIIIGIDGRSLEVYCSTQHPHQKEQRIITTHLDHLDAYYFIDDLSQRLTFGIDRIVEVGV